MIDGMHAGVQLAGVWPRQAPAAVSPRKGLSTPSNVSTTPAHARTKAATGHAAVRFTADRAPRIGRRGAAKEGSSEMLPRTSVRCSRRSTQRCRRPRQKRSRDNPAGPPRRRPPPLPAAGRQRPRGRQARARVMGFESQRGTHNRRGRPASAWKMLPAAGRRRGGQLPSQSRADTRRGPILELPIASVRAL